MLTFNSIVMLKYMFTTLLVASSFFSFAQSRDEDGVKSVLRQYLRAIEKLDAAGSDTLFTDDSQLFESGDSEGTYAHYLEHHLAPELKEFKSFEFKNYAVNVKTDGNYAFATETYDYVIVRAKDEKEIKRKGVTTSVLKKVDGRWKVYIMHSSSHK